MPNKYYLNLSKTKLLLLSTWSRKKSKYKPGNIIIYIHV